METITISKTEYKRFLTWGKRNADAATLPPLSSTRKGFKDVAFGALKKNFGTRSSVSYVNSLRKAWR